MAIYNYVHRAKDQIAINWSWINVVKGRKRFLAVWRVKFCKLLHTRLVVTGCLNSFQMGFEWIREETDSFIEKNSQKICFWCTSLGIQCIGIYKGVWKRNVSLFVVYLYQINFKLSYLMVDIKNYSPSCPCFCYFPPSAEWLETGSKRCRHTRASYHYITFGV